jgi:N-acetylmuramoyl-L-alanine amidase
MPYSSICISSGHSLYCRGASGSPVPPQLDEVDEARRMVDRIADLLRDRGVGVAVFHDNESRDQSSNLNAIVAAHNCTSRQLDVSVHFNAFDGNAHGTEVLYVTQEALAEELSMAIASAGNFTNRGGKLRTDLKFLNSTEMPAVLIETAFCDNTSDSELYREHFEDICCAIADVLGGEADDEERPDRPQRPGFPDYPPERPEQEFLFSVTGKCSHFGGPDDTTGVSASEGLAFLFDVMDKPEVFLPYQPEGTTGLARRLNPYTNYVACRWSYDTTPKSMLAGPDRALVRALATGREALAFPCDWGPNENTGRVADLSPGLCEVLGLETDMEVEVIYPYKGG